MRLYINRFGLYGAKHKSITDARIKSFSHWKETVMSIFFRTFDQSVPRHRCRMIFQDLLSQSCEILVVATAKGAYLWRPDFDRPSGWWYTQAGDGKSDHQFRYSWVPVADNNPPSARRDVKVGGSGAHLLGCLPIPLHCIKPFHVQVLFHTPARSWNMSKSCADQHKRAVSVWKAPDSICPPAYLSVNPLNTVIAPNPKPMLVRKTRVGQRFFNSTCECIRCRFQFGVSHFFCNFLCFSEAGLLIFLGEDRF